jgi:hypothetical protein
MTAPNINATAVATVFFMLTPDLLLFEFGTRVRN